MVFPLILLWLWVELPHLAELLKGGKKRLKGRLLAKWFVDPCETKPTCPWIYASDAQFFLKLVIKFCGIIKILELVTFRF